MLAEEIIKKIRNYQYISFDIFDTLILRNVSDPQDVFSFVQSVLNKRSIEFVDFKNKRIEAEKRAIKYKNRDSEEVSFDRIYELLVENREQRQFIKVIEEECELFLCVPNSELVPVMEYCRANHKKVILNSDMYLGTDMIKRILNKCDIYYDALFLSSQLGVRKSTGNLYHYMMNELRIDKKELIHIGDNAKSDYLRPKLMGIEAIKYTRKKTVLPETHPRMEESIFTALANNSNVKEEDGYKQIGFSAFGPLLCGFCQWLHSRIAEGGYDDVLFFSRDGYIMKKAYDAMYPEEAGRYIYFSRRSLTVPQLIHATDFGEIIDTVAYIKREETVGNLLHKLGVDDKLLEQELISRYGEALERDKLRNGDYEGLFESVIDIVKENAAKERELCKQYIQSNISGQKIAIVDIGWYGTMQHHFQEIARNTGMELEAHGFYLGYLGNRYQDMISEGYIFNGSEDAACNKALLFGFNGLIETFFSANHGSVKNYISDGQGIAPCLEKWEEDNWNMVSHIQDGAIDFVTKAGAVVNYADINISVHSAWKEMGRLLTQPRKNEMKLFSDIVFFDTYFEPLVSCRGLGYYLLHRKDLKRDFMKSNWKIGFLKELSGGLPVSADRVYLLLNKLK